MTTISGRVTDAHGRGVAGARVMIAEAPGEVPDIALLTEAEGRFTLGAPGPGDYVIAAVTDRSSGRQAVRVGGGSVTGVELRLA